MEATHGVLHQPCLRAPFATHHILFRPCHIASLADGLACPRGGHQMHTVKAHRSAVNVCGVEEVRRALIWCQDDLHVWLRPPALVVPNASGESLRGSEDC